MEAVALFDFEPEREDELRFRKGAILIVLIDSVEMNWSQAKLGSKVGLIPKNFIRFKPIPGCLRSISRVESQELLSKQSRNHSYLLRGSEKGKNTFSLSVKHDKEIRHFKILADDDHKYFILDKKFPSINDLIEHHKSNSLNRTDKILLSHPVSMVVKSRQRFQPRGDSTELSFSKDEKIEVTDYFDKNWWLGAINDRTGTFPVALVAPIDFPH